MSHYYPLYYYSLLSPFPSGITEIYHLLIINTHSLQRVRVQHFEMSSHTCKCLFQILVYYLMVILQNPRLLDLLVPVLQPLHNILLFLSASPPQPLLQLLQRGHINKQEVTRNLMLVRIDLLPSLHINLEDSYLNPQTNTFPREMMSLSFPLCVP